MYGVQSEPGIERPPIEGRLPLHKVPLCMEFDYGAVNDPGEQSVFTSFSTGLVIFTITFTITDSRVILGEMVAEAIVIKLPSLDSNGSHFVVPLVFSHLEHSSALGSLYFVHVC